MADMRGWIEARGDGHRARLRFPDGSNGPAKTFALKRDAKTWLDEQMVSHRKGTFVDHRAGKLPFEEWCDRWLDGRVDLRYNTLKRYRNEVSISFKPFFHGRELGAIRQPDVQKWVRWELDRGSADTTVHNRYVTLQSIFGGAVDAGLLKTSPCQKVKTPAYVPVKKAHFLTVEEVSALADAIDERYRALVWLGATGGLRISELGAARVTSIDFFRGSIEIREQLQILAGGMAEFLPVKTKAGVRRIRLPRAAVDELKAHRELYELGPDDLLFSGTRSTVLRPSTFTQGAFHRAALKAGLEPLVPHDLRHTAVSWWIKSGANPKEIQRMAGHASIRVTYDTYGHLFPDHDDHLVDKLDEMLGVEPSRRLLKIVD